ncbi:MAG: hypothetical protein ACPGQL_03500, partial [Thermoplasmatota archaeon]
MRRTLIVPILALSLLLVPLPSVSAHAAVEVLDVEIKLLEDAGDDSFALIDGYDLVSVHGREAYHPATDEEGVILRFILYGGFSPVLPQVDELSLQLDVTGDDGARTFTFATSDGGNWTGDGTIMEASVTESPFGDNAQMQVFLSHEALGTARGGSLSEFMVTSRAGEEAVDAVPGGRFLPGGVEIPEESNATTPVWNLTGPFGYTETTATLQDGTLQLDVKNLITTQGQHILLDIPETAGWTATVDADGYSFDAGEDASFSIDLGVVPGSEDLAFWVVSDLGGREAVTVQAPPAPPQPDPKPEPEAPEDVTVERPPEPATPPAGPDAGDGMDHGDHSDHMGDHDDGAGDDKDTPGFAIVPLLAALGVVAVMA